jgi:hypothetical protein
MLEHLKDQIFMAKIEGVSWYTYPPIPAYLNYPFVYFFEMETAARLIFFLLIAAVFSAYALINSVFQNIEGKDRKIILLSGVCILLLSYPFYYLIVRGHMTGIVIMLYAMGIYLLKKNNPVSGLCLGLAIGMIAYPALIVVPLFLFRRYKILIYTFFTLCLLYLYCPGLWWDFFISKVILYLDVHGWWAESCSLAHTFFYFSIIFKKMMSLAGLHSLGNIFYNYYNAASMAVYVLLLFAMLLADYKIKKKYAILDANIEIVLILMYIPFMIAVPKVVILYALVMLLALIPAMCSLMQILVKPMPKLIFLLISVGIALSQIQAQTFQNLFQPKYSFFHFFPAFGLFLVMIGCVMFKLWFWKVYPLRIQAKFS